MISFDRLRYSKIPIWENKRRITLLENFIDLINGYYSELRKPRHYAGILTPAEQQTLSLLRTRISQGLPEACSVTRLANVNPYLIGGTYSAGRPIDMLANVLNLDELRVEPAFVIDKLNEAIGTYRVDQRKSLWRAFSPVFWIARVIEYVAQSLVRFFSSILGFDQEKALGSKPGRILTQLFQTTIWLFTLVQGLAALSYLLDHFGWEIPLLHWFRFK